MLVQSVKLLLKKKKQVKEIILISPLNYLILFNIHA